MTTWTHIHADYWQSPDGQMIHRVEILDDDDCPIRLFYGHLSGAVRHCCEALSLAEARRQMEAKGGAPCTART